MPFDFILGAGREPQHLGGVMRKDVEYNGNVPFPAETVSATISEGNIMALYAIASVQVNNAVAYGNPVILQLRIANDIFARYTLPTGQTGQVLYELVPIGANYVNPVSFSMLHGGEGAGGASNYTIKCSFFYRNN